MGYSKVRQVVDQTKGGPNNPSLILSLHQALDFSRPFVNFVEPFKQSMSYKNIVFAKWGPGLCHPLLQPIFANPICNLVLLLHLNNFYAEKIK